MVITDETESPPVPDTIYSSEVFDPSRLSVEKKRHFIDSLYQLHSRIFDGIGKDDFISYVVDSPADWTRIRVYKNSTHQWIGYCAAHRFSKRLSNRPIVIMRAEAGILRQYRGRSLTLWFGFTEAIKYRIKNPFAHFITWALLCILPSFTCFPATFMSAIHDLIRQYLLNSRT